MSDKYFVDPFGLFIGLVTEPVTEIDFFEKEFENGLFKNYVEKLNLITPFKEDSKLYSPRAYRIFGEYDLAIFSLVDDLEFGLQIFKPFQSYTVEEDKLEKEEFIYNTQVINGLSTYVKEDEMLFKLAKNTFLRETDKFPFIGITKFKVNNGILIGNGVVLLESIKEKIKLLSTKITQGDNKLEIIIIDTFCNNELTVISFSNDYSIIDDYIFKIKNLQISHLKDHERFLTECFLNKLKFNEGEKININNAHLFAETNTKYGYDRELETNAHHFMKIKNEKENVDFACSWRIKPGHTRQFLENIKNSEGFGFKIETDNSYFQDTNTLHSKHTFKEILEIPKIKKQGDLLKHIKQFKIAIHFPLDNTNLLDAPIFNEHPALTNYLRNFTFKREELQILRDELNLCNTSKSSVERVLGMYNNFNNCIVDPVFFISFLDLKGYLDYLKDSIIEKCCQSHTENTPLRLKDFNDWLNECIRIFELAYRNRFHQSNRTKVLPNNSLEFNGGIQQFVSIFDALFKSVVNPMGSNWSYTEFIYVSGIERVRSDKNALSINILQMLHPELFATIIYKEGINFALNKLQMPEVSNLDSGTQGLNIEQIRKANQVFRSLETFTESNKIIYEKIVIGLKKADKDKKFTKLINLIDKDIVFNFFADIAVYTIGFDRYDEAFFFWYWKYFRQMNDYYNADSSFDDKLYQRYLLRLFLLKNFLEKNYKSENDERFHYMPVADDNMEAFCKSLFTVLEECKINEEDNFFKVCQAVVEKIQYVEIFADYKNEKKRQSEKTNYSNKRSTQVEEHSVLDFRKAWIEKRSNSFLGSLKEGLIISDFEKRLYSDSSYIQCFLNTYLSFLYDFNTELNKDTIACQAGGEETLKIAKIAPDPKGGIRIIDPEERSRYNVYRGIFYKTLWDFSMKVKYNYLDILNKTTPKTMNENIE